MLTHLHDPTLARFIQPDILVPNPGDPQSLKRYSYVRNNPVRFTDPSGHYYIEDKDPPLLNQLFDISDKQVLLPPSHPYNPTDQGILVSASTVESWGEEITCDVPSVIPDEGTRTYSLPVITGGAFFYGSIAPIQINVSSNGDVLLTGSVEGGGMTIGGASVAATVQQWDTENVYDLLGFYATVGGSGGEGVVAGSEYSTFDSNGAQYPGGQISGKQFGIGYGFGPPVEAHLGLGYTWPYAPKFNIYDLH